MVKRGVLAVRKSVENCKSSYAKHLTPLITIGDPFDFSFAEVEVLLAGDKLEELPGNNPWSSVSFFMVSLV